MSSPLRIANASGFYGDRASAMHEQLAGGEIDVLTGDYLAELTMLILGRDRLKDANLGYAKTFLRQLESTLGIALDKGVKIVSNAGGLESRRGWPPRSALSPTSSASTSWLRTSRGTTWCRGPVSSGWANRSPPTPTWARGASPTASPRAPTSWSPAGSPTHRW